MVAAVTGDNTQLGVIALGEGSPTLTASQLGVLAVHNIYASTEATVQLGMTFLAESSPPMSVTQMSVMAVYKVRPADPTIRAWTFTLDGHDFYVIKLGDIETLVYDVYSEQWMVWGDGDFAVWQLQTGRNWVNSGDKPNTYGSNVVAGDYDDGSLYLFDPDYLYDDHWDETGNTFTRVAQAFLPTTSRGKIPVYSLTAYGSMGYSPATTTAYLSYSDDNGETYVPVSTQTVPEDEATFDLSWRGLGSFSYPGRLFRLQDTGALQRLDGVSVMINGE